jgi:formylglycine-generating enzyme required for sulfatase activity
LAENDMIKASLGKKVRCFLIATLFSAFNPLYTFAQIKNDMVLIPSGKLMVSAEYRSTETFIDKFFMDRFEVTQESYEKIIGYNPSFFVDKNRPVEKVNWFEAEEYSLKIGKRLPNEWEWEWASRSGDTSKFYWRKEDPKLYSWFKKNSEKKTHPVGQKNPTHMACLTCRETVGCGLIVFMKR